MTDIWYRGESTNHTPSKPGSEPHDFGDGWYFSDSRDVAALYADNRVSRAGGQPKVLAMSPQPQKLGRVLDLQGAKWGPVWKKFLEAPMLPGHSLTRGKVLELPNHSKYSDFFNEFTKQNRIDLANYDTVIGPEMTKGGRQLCVLHKNGQFSTIAEHLRRDLREVPALVMPETENIPVVSGEELLRPRSGTGRVLNTESFKTGLAMAIAAVSNYLTDMAINKSFQNDLDLRWDNIQNHLDRGMGVLLIITINQRHDFMTGMTFKKYNKTYMEPALTRAAALRQWHKPGYIRSAALPNNVLVDEYVWISPVP